MDQTNFTELLLLEAIEDLQRDRFNQQLPKSDDNERRKAKAEIFQEKLKQEHINTFEDLQKIVDETDPTKGNYKRWLYDKWFSGGFKTEDKDKVKNYLKTYNANRSRLPKQFQDINKIESSGSLFSILKDSGYLGIETSQVNIQELKDLEKSGDLERFGENNEWIGWIPKTVKGSCAVGKNTEWCTAKYGEQDERNKFKAYSDEGDLYSFIRKKEGLPSKIQMHVSTKSIMDENDEPTQIPKGIWEIILAKNDIDLTNFLVTNSPEILNSGLVDINIVKSLDAKDRIEVARNENTPVEVLMILAKDENGDVREGLAQNKNIPEEAAKIFANPALEEDVYVRGVLAKNENIKPYILEILAKDPQSDIRAYVALNPNTPENVLRYFLENKNEYDYIRITAIRNKKTPIDAIEAIANTPYKRSESEVISSAKDELRLRRKLTEAVIYKVIIKLSKFI